MMLIQRQGLLSPLCVSRVNESSCFPLLQDASHAIPAAGLSSHQSLQDSDQSLPLQRGTSFILMSLKCTWGYFSFLKILLAVVYISHLPWPVNSNLALHLALWNRHMQPEFVQNTMPYFWICILPAIALPLPSPHLLKDSTLGMGHSCFFYKKQKGKFQPEETRDVFLSEYEI